LLLSARAFGGITAPAELPRGLLISAGGICVNGINRLIEWVTTPADTL